MRWAKKAKTGRSSAKSVLTWLADMCGSDLTTYPSIAALSEATELDKKTVQASLQHLIAMGFIQDTGERRGRTKQIPVYKLIGVEESIFDAERTQNREHYQKRDCSKNTENGAVTGKEPKNGTVKNNQTIPFFPANDPKNGIRNPPEESKDLNPIHNARGIEVEPVSQNPGHEYAGQPGMLFPAAHMIGKFPMKPDWTPSPDFRRQAVLWGKPLKDGLNLHAELKGFIDYWIAEGKAFAQTQWEQKFASWLHRAGTTQPRGNTHAGLDPNPTANAAVQRARAARAEQLRARGEGVEILGADAGNLLHSLGDQKRLGPVGPMDCADWEFDQRPDDERV